MTPSRPTLLPPEHGAWAFLLLPSLSAFGLRPGMAALGLFGSGLCAFLARVPLRRSVRTGRLSWFDLAWMAAYTLLGAAGLGFALDRSGPGFLAALVPAIPLGVWLMRLDLRGGARTLGAEWASIALPSLLAVAMVRAGRGPWTLALGLGIGSFLSLAAPVAYLRARLSLRRGKGAAALPALAIHGAAFLGAVGLRWSLPANSATLLAWLWPAWMGMLLLRALLEPLVEPKTPDPRSLGMREALVCAVSALALVLSIRGA